MTDYKRLAEQEIEDALPVQSVVPKEFSLRFAQVYATLAVVDAIKGGKTDEENQELIAALAIREEELATLRNDFHQLRNQWSVWRARAYKAEGDLAKFHECEGECIFDTSTGEYAEAEEHPFKVYHRDGE
jgi:hypothetical protein